MMQADGVQRKKRKESVLRPAKVCVFFSHQIKTELRVRSTANWCRDPSTGQLEVTSSVAAVHVSSGSSAWSTDVWGRIVTAAALLAV